MADRVAAVEQRLDRTISGLEPTAHRLAPDDPLRAGSTLTAAAAVELFGDQVRSRALDVAARGLRARGQGYYTISSAGHEMNAVVGAVTRPDDPAFLHYRSGGFFLARARKVAGVDGVGAVARSFAAAADEPASGGRHKVFGSHAMWIPPQTSTIASHLPKAVGTAVLLDRGPDAPRDAVVVCSFGDASVNHATALSAINAARYARRLGAPVPLVLVCEDNGLGISVPTPRRWIEQSLGALPHLRYVRAQGELDEIHDTVAEAIGDAREHRRPVFVHLPVVRLWGHAGSDIETGYRSNDEIRADEDRDPLLAVARRLVMLGAATPAQLAEVVAAARQEVTTAAEEAAGRAPLASRAEVVRPLAPYDRDATRAAITPAAPVEQRRQHADGRLPEEAEATGARTLAAHLNAALQDELLAAPDVLAFGEDVGRKGGVYGVTARLQERFGQARVFDTLLDETTILGLAQGAGLLGLLAVPEIQYLAYLHNAIDQLRGEAASTSFFSDGRFTTPMVVRLPGLAYQKGFGGHFHNDNAIAALLEIPGLVVASPSRGDDAARLLRGCLATARANGRVVCFLEPIALYHERDLFEEGDGRWCSDYPPPPEAILPGEVGTSGPADAEVVVLSFANGVRMTHRAARQAGVEVRVVDLRWLAPLPWDAIEQQVTAARHVVVVDECRASGGVADRLLAGLHRRRPQLATSAVTSADSYLPLGPAADHVVLTEEQVAEALLQAHAGGR
jgi:2-oxoisovalerate dehydrogenase E1 component